MKPTLSTTKLLSSITLGLVIAIVSTTPAVAANYTWSGANSASWFGTGNTLATGNWSSTGTLASTDTVVFGSSTRTSPSLNNSATVSGLVFTSTASTYAMTSPSGRQLTITGSLVNQSSSMQTFGTAATSPQLRFGASGGNAIVNTGTAGITFVSGITSSGGGGFTKTGSGDLNLNGTLANFTSTITGSGGNIYVNAGQGLSTGAINMTTGTLFYAPSGGNFVGGTNTSIVFTGTGQRLSDTMTINGNLSSTYDIVGNTENNTISVGTLTFGSSAFNSMDFYGVGGLNVSDQFQATNLTYGGTLSLNLLNAVGDDIIDEGTTWQLFGVDGVAATTVSGSLDAMSLVVPSSNPYYSSIAGNPWHLAENGNRYETAYGAGVWLSDWTTNGQRFIFSQSTGVLTVVPEPSTIVFASIGIVMLGWHTWTRSRRKARMSLVEEHLQRLNTARGRA